MKFYWVKTNWIIKKIFANYTWSVASKQNTVYLTFDDGPIPEITEFVLAELKKYNAKIKVDSSDKETFFEIEFVKKGDGLL